MVHIKGWYYCRTLHGNKKDILGVFGANIVSNTYQDGKGVIVFDDDVKQIGGLAFQKSSNLTSISIPESVTKIARGSFYDCTNLTSITIPNSVTDIEEWAFNKCTSLTNIFIPNSVVRIGDRAFFECTGLTSVEIPNSVTSIGDYAFYKCSGLISVTIGNSVTSIGDHAFTNCTSLTSIYCKSSNPPTLNSYIVFNGVPSDCNLYVPTESVDIYKKTERWKRYFYSTTVGYDFTQDYSNNSLKSKQIEDNEDKYDVMLEEFALKVDRLMDLIYDMSDSDNPFAYTKQIETLAAECEKLEKNLNRAPLDSRQKLYKNEIKAELEDAIRRLTWN